MSKLSARALIDNYIELCAWNREEPSGAGVLRELERNGYEITEILTYTESRPGGRDRRKLG